MSRQSIRSGQAILNEAQRAACLRNKFFAAVGAQPLKEKEYVHWLNHYLASGGEITNEAKKPGFAESLYSIIEPMNPSVRARSRWVRATRWPARVSVPWIRDKEDAFNILIPPAVISDNELQDLINAESSRYGSSVILFYHKQDGQLRARTSSPEEIIISRSTEQCMKRHKGYKRAIKEV